MSDWWCASSNGVLRATVSGASGGGGEGLSDRSARGRADQGRGLL